MPRNPEGLSPSAQKGIDMSELQHRPGRPSSQTPPIVVFIPGAITGIHGEDRLYKQDDGSGDTTSLIVTNKEPDNPFLESGWNVWLEIAYDGRYWGDENRRRESMVVGPCTVPDDATLLPMPIPLGEWLQRPDAGGAERDREAYLLIRVYRSRPGLDYPSGPPILYQILYLDYVRGDIQPIEVPGTDPASGSIHLENYRLPNGDIRIPMHLEGRFVSADLIVMCTKDFPRVYRATAEPGQLVNIDIPASEAPEEGSNVDFYAVPNPDVHQPAFSAETFRVSATYGERHDYLQRAEAFLLSPANRAHRRHGNLAFDRWLYVDGDTERGELIADIYLPDVDAIERSNIVIHEKIFTNERSVFWLDLSVIWSERVGDDFESENILGEEIRVNADMIANGFRMPMSVLSFPRAARTGILSVSYYEAIVGNTKPASPSYAYRASISLHQRDGEGAQNERYPPLDIIESTKDDSGRFVLDIANLPRSPNGHWVTVLAHWNPIVSYGIGLISPVVLGAAWYPEHGFAVKEEARDLDGLAERGEPLGVCYIPPNWRDPLDFVSHYREFHVVDSRLGARKR